MCAYVHACIRACACVCASMRACVCVHVCVYLLLSVFRFVVVAYWTRSVTIKPCLLWIKTVSKWYRWIDKFILTFFCVCLSGTITSGDCSSHTFDSKRRSNDPTRMQHDVMDGKPLQREAPSLFYQMTSSASGRSHSPHFTLLYAKKFPIFPHTWS